LKDAFYAKYFGAKHPFKLKMKGYLIETFPYTNNSFKELLKAHFEYSKRKQHNLSHEEWQEDAFTHIIKRHFPNCEGCFLYDKHYVRLTSLLQSLGVDFPPLTKDSLKFWE